MAAKRKRKATKPAKDAGKQAKNKAKKEKEPKEIKPGPPVESVMAVVTGILLLVAILMIDYARGSQNGDGNFFSEKYIELYGNQ
jgi:hypothetical protein